MAIFHLEGQIISRNQGRSSVAAAAYRSASCLLDKHTGLTHDFSNKQSDLVYAEILLPEGAPAWMSVPFRWLRMKSKNFSIKFPSEFITGENHDQRVTAINSICIQN